MHRIKPLSYLNEAVTIEPWWYNHYMYCEGNNTDSGNRVMAVMLLIMVISSHVRWVPVTTTWRALGLRMEGTASIYGG